MTSQPTDTFKPFTSIICIPGQWTDRDEFLRNIVSSTKGEYMAAGGILFNGKDNTSLLFEFCGRDAKMASAFEHAGKVARVSDSFLRQIEQHTNVVYVSHQTGTIDAAKNIAYAANVILTAGGLGIKIETVGKAFEKSQWANMIQRFTTPTLYQMFVIDSLVIGDGTVFSCGMQNIGYKDTIVSGLDFQSAVDLISIFNYYQIVDKPTIQSRQTFSKTSDAPIFIISDEPNYPYKGDELFGNPNGMWRLTKLGGA